VIPRLELRVERGGPRAPALYFDRFTDHWFRVRGERIESCVRCGSASADLFMHATKRGAYCRQCVTVWTRARVKRAWPPAIDLGPGGIVKRCRRCRRPLKDERAKGEGIGHTCVDRLATDGQLPLPLEDESQARIR
jgi:hypothetical protein